MRRTEIPPGYSPVAKWLHWLILALLVVQYTLAWTMPDTPRGAQPGVLTKLHLSFGVLILLLMLVRLGWRIGHKVPPTPEALAPWMDWGARLVHYALYALLILLPLAGWGWASVKPWPVRVFGIGPLPALAAPESSWRPVFAWFHHNGAYAVLGLVGLHILAALYHHFVRHDDVLRRMWPGET